MQVLAIGFLLVILSSALWHKYWPLLVVAIYVIAPLPNWICSRCANPDDFMDSSSNSAMDFGRFMTGFLVLTGIGELLPASLFPFALSRGPRAWPVLKFLGRCTIGYYPALIALLNCCPPLASFANTISGSTPRRPGAQRRN